MRHQWQKRSVGDWLLNIRGHLKRTFSLEGEEVDQKWTGKLSISSPEGEGLDQKRTRRLSVDKF